LLEEVTWNEEHGKHPRRHHPNIVPKMHARVSWSALACGLTAMVLLARCSASSEVGGGEESSCGDDAVAAGSAVIGATGEAALGAAAAAAPEGDDDVPHFTIGVLADVQYADSEDGFDFYTNSRRQYRASAPALERALAHFKDKVSFVLQLGDMIDGRDSHRGQEHWDEVFFPMLDRQGFRVGGNESVAEDVTDVHFIVGNHDLYCFDRDTLDTVMGTGRDAESHAHYYSFVPAPGWRFVALDPFDVSTLNRHKQLTEEAFEMLEKNNPGLGDKDDWTDGLHGLERRWLPLNGAVGSTQLEWLRKELAAAEAANEKVIVLSHVSVCPGAAAPEKLIWNYEEVLSVLHEAPKGLVVSCLSGHDHAGGYQVDQHGIHHKTVEAVLEAQDGAFLMMDVFSDRVELRNAVENTALQVWPLHTGED
jgi:manganese-dependent ADP-ribose/CDP-alcohol diphosphatase